MRFVSALHILDLILTHPFDLLIFALLGEWRLADNKFAKPARGAHEVNRIQNVNLYGEIDSLPPSFCVVYISS